MSVQNSEIWEYNTNYYKATVVVRINGKGVFLHDVISVKKKHISRWWITQKLLSVENRFF